MADSISSPVSLISMVIFGTFVAFLIYYFLLPALFNWVAKKLGGQGTFEKHVTQLPILISLTFILLY